LASPTTSAVIINGITPLAAVAAAVIRVLLGIVTTLAGQTTAGTADGTGAAASFGGPTGVAVTSSGVIVVADRNNHRIRLITPTGVVTTLAGSGSGSADGTGTGATFSLPSAVAVIPSSGVIVVADSGNHRIRLITPGGVVTTLAGSGQGSADGTGAGASFNFPTGVAVIPSSGVIVVADQGNHRIRLVTPAGVVTTLAGSGTGQFAEGTGTGASFNNPTGVAVTSSGDIVVADVSNQRIRMITPSGVVTTLAGQTTAGTADGTGAAASFTNPYGVAVIPSSDVIVVADNFVHRVRLVTPTGVVTTLAGSGSPGFADGTGAAATFNRPWGVAATPSGDIVVADFDGNRIRLIV
jgi:sugar lactone lactonase YvrE